MEQIAHRVPGQVGTYQIARRLSDQSWSFDLVYAMIPVVGFTVARVGRYATSHNSTIVKSAGCIMGTLAGYHIKF